jgi:uncharacterized RDD family membrane protein YckC
MSTTPHERVHRVLLPENVELRFQLAEPGSRIAAGTIDYALLYGGIVACIIAMARFRESLRDVDEHLRGVPLLNDPYFPETMMAVLLFGAFAAWWGYFTLFELLWNGQTPGKRLLGLRVVRANGNPLSAAASLVRNLMRAIDAVAMLGIVVMFLDGRSRRLGDFAAGTLVVRVVPEVAHGLIRLIPIEGRPANVAKLAPLVGRLDPRHSGLIREVFARQGTMKDMYWAVLAYDLAWKIAVRLGIPGPELRHSAQFLADVAYAIDARAGALESD